MIPVRIDCHALGGVAGDMFAAALFDACPWLYDDFLKDLAQLNIEGLDAILSKQTSKGLYAQHFSVNQSTDEKPPRTLPAVIDFLNGKSLDSGITDVAIDIYRLLAKAEAAVHGKPVETVHFHEVSDWDSMVDILAAAGIIARLDCRQWRIGPLPLGGGTITTAHGDIPLPAPATVQLLESFEWSDDGQPGERVTPTGAAILAYLKPDKLQQKTGAARLAQTGVGCGTRQLADRANIFRVCIFEQPETNMVCSDPVTHLAFEVDDMTAEEIAQSIDILRDESGVLDISTVVMQGKKGRQATGLRLLLAPDAMDAVIEQCFRQTTTLGVRHMNLQRKILHRDHKEIDGYPVKTACRPQGTLTAKVERDCLNEIETLQARRALALTIEKSAVDD